MVQLEKDKIVITIETSAPAELLSDIIGSIPLCVQAAQMGHKELVDDKFTDSIYFLMELYKALLPDEEQTRRIFEAGD